MSLENKRQPIKKILIAAGGTGGHLFPAQALARDFKKEEIEVLFAGGKLGSNPFFYPLQFPFREISGASPFRTNPFRAGLQLFKGVREGIRVMEEFLPDCVVGFGSFYTFPLLAAARWKKIPYVLVESNVHPGRVNRLFSAKSCFSAVQFEESSKLLKGRVLPARIPFWAQEKESAFLEPREAKKYFHLDPDRFTLLIFGGSQGAKVLNQVVSFLENDLQVIHLCGKNQDMEKLISLYKEKGIRSSVKPFEEKMHLALRAADLALARGGAGTVSELIEYSLPSILVPWPGSSENHQYKNVKMLADKGGAILLQEPNISSFSAHLQEARGKLSSMRAALEREKQKESKELYKLIREQLER